MARGYRGAELDQLLPSRHPRCTNKDRTFPIQRRQGLLLSLLDRGHAWASELPLGGADARISICFPLTMADRGALLCYQSRRSHDAVRVRAARLLLMLICCFCCSGSVPAVLHLLLETYPRPYQPPQSNLSAPIEEVPTNRVDY